MRWTRVTGGGANLRATGQGHWVRKCNVCVASQCYYQLRKFRPLVRCMSAEAVKTLIQAFSSCRLGYCNSRHRRGSDEPANAAPACTFRVGRSTLRPHHAMLQVLHWLPVRRRVDFKMATLVYLSLTGWLCGRRLSVGLRRQ